MAVKFEGPNPNFTNMKKDGGDVKPGDGKSVMVESVNHEDFSGRKRLADKNPGTGENSRTVHAKAPFTEGALSGMEQPKMGEQDGKISSNVSMNEPPRAFKVNREGHAIDRGSVSENATK